MKEQIATKADLTALNRFTLKELKEDDVFIFAAKFIDSEPTANGRIWTKEWMEAAIERKLFEGIPFLTDHENQQTMKIGTVFMAEMKDDGIYGRVFVPLDKQGQEAKEAVENGRIRSVSINADGELKREGDITKILPSETMRVFEVSAVAVPGCKTCVITEQTSGGACESKDDPKKSKNETSMLKFAEEQLTELQAEYIRLAGFTLGTSDFDRDLYKKVAESLDPLTLRSLTKDLRESYNKSQNESQTIEQEVGSVEEIKRSLEHINKVKGV